MYIWVAFDVSEQVRELREYAECYVAGLGLDSPTLTLPFHISLKISFQIPDERVGEAVCEIRQFCQSLKPFSIGVKGIEQNGPIVWLTMKDTLELTHIHRELDQLMLQKYGVEQHPFDQDFIFHTSILIMDCAEQASHALHSIKDVEIPHTLQGKRVIIGSSVSGQAGTYHVDEVIEIESKQPCLTSSPK